MTDWFEAEKKHAWTLFLDRDGVINERLPGDYVKNTGEFRFTEGTLEALRLLAPLFKYIVVVTNQQGIGKGVMTEADLYRIHTHMLNEVSRHGGRIDGVYHCPDLAEDNPACRKPNTGMALQAQRQFPGIDFRYSVMVGDSDSDMEFGTRLGMKCVRIGQDPDHESYPALINFARRISSV